MKFKYILIVLSVLQFGACSDDKGNYIYKEINELMVVENLDCLLYTSDAADD